jgi:hypothetical protein
MKTSFKVLLPLALLLTLPPVVHAQFQFITNNGAITITGYYGPGGAITIPSTVNGLPVISIGDGAFADNGILTSVTIPNSVTSIGMDAFESCYGLASVTIPNSVTSLGDGAFFQCLGLTSVSIGYSVARIGMEVFSGTLLTDVTIPNSVTSIGVEAFYCCTRLTSVTIGNSVTSIYYAAFADCTRLTGVYFKGNAPSLLDYGVFDYDNAVTVYYSAGTMGWGATFDDRPTALWYPPGPYTYSTDNGTITITGYTGPGGAVAVPSTMDGLPVTGIAANAFAYSGRLTSLTIPNSVTNIGGYALGYCPALTAVYFKGNAPTADSSVFYGDSYPTVYYLLGSTGWDTTFGGCPVVVWNPQVQTSGATFARLLQREKHCH